jgi:hypothetical protein
MAFPEILKGILPAESELGRGVRSGTLSCPRWSKTCEGNCASCLIADEFHLAFDSMGYFGITEISKLEQSQQTYVSGIGNFETRDGRIMFELISKFDIKSIRSA